MSDLISRQAAIDALDCINGVEEVLRALPSAQPEIKTDGDTISRQKAIDALCKRCDLVNDDTCGEKCIDIKILEKLPPAEPERKKGEWINRSLNILYPEFERYTCSVCGKHSYSYDFCPHCGSYNGGENHDKG